MEIAVSDTGYQFTVVHLLNGLKRSVMSISHPESSVLQDELRDTLCDFMTVV